MKEKKVGRHLNVIVHNVPELSSEVERLITLILSQTSASNT